jgi:class 3 adenylate cyclase
MDVPESRYVRTSDAYVAYQVLGDGPLDVLVPTDAAMALEVLWEEPAAARFIERLATFSRVVLVQSRGWATLHADHTLETNVADAIAVLDAIDSDEAAVFASADAGLSGVFMAATYPSRTRCLVLCNAYARLFRADGYSFGLPLELEDELVDLVEQGWGTGNSVELLAPSRSGDERFRRWCAKSQRVRASPREAATAFRMWVHGDVRDVLPAVRVPTLVLHRRSDRYVRVEHGRYLAAHIDGAKYVELPGDDHLVVAGDTERLIDEVEEFLTGTRRATETDRVLSTIMFTDMVGSTVRLVEDGDRRWQERLDRHDSAVRAELARFQGCEINTMGDAFVATFDGPGRAIRCACRIRDALRSANIDVRIGLHTGELERRGDDISGIAVVIAQRIQARAHAGEVLVSSTVKDLVAGSSIAFTDRGTSSLKGVPDEWRVFRAEA